MAMNLRIDFAETKGVGNQVKSYSDDFKRLLGDIKTQNENLKSHWQGGDADSYTNKITEQAQVMDKLQKSIEEIGNYLVKVSESYQKAQEENTL